MPSRQEIETWKYKYTTLLLVSLVVFFLLARMPSVQAAIESVGEWGYVGSFVAGLFFVSAFTFAPASFVLFFLAEHHGIVVVSILGGLGAVAGDYIIFRFLKDRVFSELREIYLRLGGAWLTRVLSAPRCRWVLPVLGAVIIASPFPDEVGIGLLGLSRVKEWQFVLVSLVLNTLGILTIIAIASAV